MPEESKEEVKVSKLESLKKFYNNNYKKLMIIPFLILILSIVVLGFWKVNTGEFISKDISLKGGLLITVQTDQILDTKAVEDALIRELGVSVHVKELRAIGGGTIGYTIELEELEDIEEVKETIRSVTGLALEEGTYTIEQMSSALGGTFWQSTIKALLLAFVFMSIVVFIFFRVFVPSAAVILAAVSDIVGTLAIMNLLGMTLSTAGVAAFLMLVGYSVDTDIVLSTRVLRKKEGTLYERVHSAMKTGLTMQGTTIVALTVLWIVSPAPVLRQIAAVLLIGLILDTVNTWIQNAGILTWYMEAKSGQS